LIYLLVALVMFFSPAGAPARQPSSASSQ
jgi:hypothetical protein